MLSYVDQVSMEGPTVGGGSAGTMATSSSTALMEAFQELAAVSTYLEKVAPGATSEPAPAPEAPADDFCIVCWVELRTHLVIPCGHKCLCEACSATIGEQCPMCRGPKVGVYRVFE